MSSFKYFLLGLLCLSCGGEDFAASDGGLADQARQDMTADLDIGDAPNYWGDAGDVSIPDFVVELVWDGNAGEVDLHCVWLLPKAAWGVPPHDVWQKNTFPEWGEPGPSDNPILAAQSGREYLEFEPFVGQFQCMMYRPDNGDGVLRVDMELLVAGQEIPRGPFGMTPGIYQHIGRLRRVKDGRLCMEGLVPPPIPTRDPPALDLSEVDCGS